MPATSLLARLGLRLATLGSAASLAIAAPIAEDDVSQAAHTHAARTGIYFPTTNSLAIVVDAVESIRCAQDGVFIESYRTGLVPGDAWIPLSVRKDITATTELFDDCIAQAVSVVASTRLDKVWTAGVTRGEAINAVVYVTDPADGGAYTGVEGLLVSTYLDSSLSAGKNLNVVYVIGLEMGVYVAANDTGTVTLSDGVYGIYMDMLVKGTIAPNVYGIYVGMYSDAANTITSWYGLYIGPVGDGVTNLYGIYQDDALATNVFKGLMVLEAAEDHAITEVAIDTVLDVTHYTVLVDASGGNVNIDLPDSTATGNINGRVYNVKKIDASANTVTVRRTGASDLIDGVATDVLTVQYQSHGYQCRVLTGTWNII